jgi:hypothetical protein
MEKGKTARVFGRSSFTRSDAPEEGLIILEDSGECAGDVSRSITAQKRILVMFRHEILFFLDA